ncbi:MAG: LacI family DNA-binding transcriptional regulator [Ignavibacterium sp.]|nr:MAG: LacI family DNA-binding transcriptional regulator [Ignavibacterium sp.]
MNEVTIKDIAEALKISPSTVSRALSDHPDISESTKKRVINKASSLNYNPNIVAQSLKSNKTKLIGVIVPEIEHSFFASAISGIEEVAYRSGYIIVVCSSEESYDREVVNTNALVSNRAAGLIVSISQTTTNSDHLKAVMKRNIPLVLFDRVIEDLNTSKVIIDDKNSAFNAVNYLIGKGYKDIAHLAGKQEVNICRLRFEGYCKALQDNNIPINENYIFYGGLHEQDGYNSIEQMIKQKNIPEAIFAVNDPVAIGAFKRLREEGFSIPEQIAIVGFSNNPIAEIIEPKLTTVNQPAYEMGRKAAELIINQIKSGESPPKFMTEILDTELIVRESA